MIIQGAYEADVKKVPSL